MTNWNAGVNEKAKTKLGLPIAPMTLADNLDGCFKLIKRNWKALLLLSIPMSLPGVLVSVVTSPDMANDPFGAALLEPQAGAEIIWTEAFLGGPIGLAIFIAAIVVSFLITPYFTGLIVRIFAGSYLDKEAPLSAAASQVWSRFLSLLAVMILTALAVFGSSVPVLIPVGLLTMAVPVAFLLFPLVLIPIIVVSVMLSFAYHAVVVEEVGAVTALSRSWSLVSRRFFPVLGILALLMILTVIVVSVVGFSFAFLAIIAGFIFAPIGIVVLAFSNYVTSVVSVAVVLACVTLLYFDARIRLEGFDLVLKANQQAGQQTNRPSGEASPPMNG